MEEEKRPTTENKIAEIKANIIANSKDAKWAKQMLSQLAGLYLMDRIIDVPLKDVKESIDFGACEIHKVKDGYVFVAKGGMETHVSMRMQSICAMLDTLVELHNKSDKSADEQIIYENFRDAILYNFQCVIFGSISEKSLFDNATAILRSFNDYAEEHYSNADVKEETEQDLRDNIEFEKTSEALEQIVNAPLPPED